MRQPNAVSIGERNLPGIRPVQEATDTCLNPSPTIVSCRCRLPIAILLLVASLVETCGCSAWRNSCAGTHSDCDKVGPVSVTEQSVVTCLAVSMDERLVACGTADGRVILSSAERGRIGMLSCDSRGVTSVAIAPNNATIATASMSGSLTLWEFPSCRQRLRIHAGAELADGVFFVGCGTYILTASVDGLLQKWEVSSGKMAAQVRVPAVRPFQMLVSEDRTHCLVAGRQGTEPRENVVLLMNLQTMDPDVWTLSDTGHTRVALSSDGKLLAIARREARVDIIDTYTRETVSRINGGNPGMKSISSMCFTSDSKYLATAAGELVCAPVLLQVWRITTGERCFSATLAPGAGSGIVFNASDDSVLSAGWDGCVNRTRISAVHGAVPE